MHVAAPSELGALAWEGDLTLPSTPCQGVAPMRLRHLHIPDLHLTGRAMDGEGWAVEQFNQDLVTVFQWKGIRP